MAGIFGFMLREPRPSTWTAARLAEMAARTTRHPDHRAFTEVRGQFAIGGSGPGLLDGNLRSYEGPRGAVLVPEGEMYHAADRFAHRHSSDRGWPALLDEWLAEGIDAVARTDGLFNLVVFERESREGPRLTLVNDRWGSRRLYILDLDAAFVFASELSPLVPWLRGRDDLDPRFVEETICFGAPLEGRTWFRAVALMPAATEFVVLADRSRQHRYWSWNDTVPAAAPPPNHVDELAHLWTRAIGARLNGGKVGQQLSGGLDSRLILAEAYARASNWCAVTYGEIESDEVRCARRASEIARCRWHHIALPGPDWLERRVSMSIEADGFLDLINAHQAGHLPEYRRLMSFEVSGFLGDVMLGDTALQIDRAEAFDKLSYWPSPVGLPPDTAFDRVMASVGSRDPATWLLETKWRRATNGWPHAAVNDLEVRKPFLDYALVDFAARIPAERRRNRALQIELMRRYYRPFLSAPWQKTGVRVDAPAPAHAAFRILRFGYRRLHPLARRVGWPLKPWIRGAADVNAWFDQRTIRDEFTARLTAPNARIRGFFDRDTVSKTIADVFDRRRVAIEVAANLYRVERYLEHLDRRVSVNTAHPAAATADAAIA